MAKDLFADTTMSFGEHLEALRSHLFRCVIYLLVACVPATYFAEDVLDIVTAPILGALDDYDPDAADKAEEFRDNAKDAFDWRDWWPGTDPLGGGEPGVVSDPPDPAAADAADLPPTVILTVPKGVLRAELGLPPGPDDADLATLPLSGESLALLTGGQAAAGRLVTKDVTEPFIIYIKAILVTAFVAVSPLIFGELWVFVGAGLYPHERKYVYLYLPISLGLFFTGAAFAYLVVFNFVLPFLLSFNALVGTDPFLEAGKWFNFALILPAMFGVSFQLPLVMLAANRLGIVSVEQYRTNTRFAILGIAGASMLLTPSDPGSMIAMMIPLTALYFVGIAMCDYFPRGMQENPFADEPDRAKIGA